MEALENLPSFGVKLSLGPWGNPQIITKIAIQNHLKKTLSITLKCQIQRLINE